MNKRLIAPLSLTAAILLGLSLWAFAAKPYAFNDIPAGSWYEEAALWCRENGIMNGTSYNEFSPEQAMTRSMLVTVIYRAESCPPPTGDATFSDIDPDAYYSSAVAWATENGLITGYSSKAFAPNDPITREQLAAVLWRYAESPESENTDSFADDSSISEYAKAAVSWAKAEGLISGKDENIFAPQDYASRGQLAVILHKYLYNDEVLKSPSPSTEPSSEPAETSAPTPSAAPTPSPTAKPTPKPTSRPSSGSGSRPDPTPETEPTPSPTAKPTAKPSPTLSPGISPEATPDPETKPDEGESNLETTTYKLNDVSFTMILVEGGTFAMGANDRLSDQAPEHEVTLSSYLVGETEVTQSLWQEVMGSNPSGSNRGADYPVENVTWSKSHDFVQKLNEKAHENGLIPDDLNFRMLSEAQWEFAARGGNESKGYVYSGSDTLSDVGWTSNENGRTSHKVKLKAPNELGIYDMSGNVYEWVADYYAPYSPEAQTNPCNLTEINSNRQVIKRGGSFWYNDEYRYTCTYRYAYYENITDESIGLRICLY